MKVTSSEDNPDQVENEYNWKHDNHVPGSVDDMVIAPINCDAHLVLQDLVESHFNWKSIKGILQQDRAKLAVMLEMGTNANIEESHRLSYQSIYYQINKFMTKSSRLHAHVDQSLMLWQDKIKSSGGQCFTKNIHMKEGMLMFAFMSNWSQAY
ncbi:hypothetical protein BC941DRAFT_441128 [Chlamydoabsidia padenii]|nr:hypothetical protein BC941DRAFT_441128 [Chlamydoabsidia padenii]